MAKPEHVERLKAGVEEWNEWRESTDEIPDLRDASVSITNTRAGGSPPGRATRGDTGAAVE